ncbi:hypothetical protein, partial [Pseudescherichia vulneris]|uniref:hypothetical protein n=1 Tax=Pseudescherichia vulneris TaxID=566 RepID=UPI0028A95D0C
MTLVALEARRKPFTRQNLSRSHRISAESVKNRRSVKKIQKRLVQKNGIPIMRLHRNGKRESLHGN